MKYRTADKSDRASLVSLWQEAFGDSESIISQLFDSVISLENAVVADENGEIISALYLIDAEIVSGERRYKAYYIYAAATKKQYRGRGVMSALLKFTDSVARRKKADYLFLRPADEGLYNFYSQNGFVTAFYEKEARLTADSVITALPYVKWDGGIIKFDADSSDSESFFSENGYASLESLREGLRVNYFVSGNPKRLFEDILTKYGETDLTAYIPAACDDTNAVKTGMIKRINSDAEDIVSAYLGITLE